VDARSLLERPADPPEGVPEPGSIRVGPGDAEQGPGDSTHVTVSDLFGDGQLPKAPPDKSWLPKLDLSRLSQAMASLLRPRVAGTVLLGFGLLILLVLAYIYGFTQLSEQRAQNQLLRSISSTLPSAEAATYNLSLGKTPAQGRPVAVLEIPALGIDDAVVEGSDAQDLRNGPGHMSTTPLPGQHGNSVIAGRRITYGAPFGALGSLERGDVIHVLDGYGSFRYHVVKVVTVGAGQPDVVNPTTSNRLTLVTASSGLLTSGRLAVIADLVGTPARYTVLPHFHPSAAQLATGGDPVSGLLFLAWGLLFVALLTATVGVLRRWSQPVVVLLLAVPLLIAIALLACESLVGLLPGTV
jgi:sortase A